MTRKKLKNLLFGTCLLTLVSMIALNNKFNIYSFDENKVSLQDGTKRNNEISILCAQQTVSQTVAPPLTQSNTKMTSTPVGESSTIRFDLLKAQLEISRHRTAKMAIGIPTIKREKETYLYRTVNSILESSTYDELKSVVIVIFIGEVKNRIFSFF